MYATFLTRLGELYTPTKIKGTTTLWTSHRASPTERWHTYPSDGRFGAMMSVSLVNEVRAGCDYQTPSADLTLVASTGTSNNSH